MVSGMGRSLSGRPTSRSTAEVRVPGVTAAREAAEVTRPAGAGEVVQVMTVVGDARTADGLARSAVEQRLAACAQVEGPIRSTYRWEGELHTDEEWRVVVKTSAFAAGALVRSWSSVHPYELPEILVVPVVGGLRGYLEWVADEVAPISR